VALLEGVWEVRTEFLELSQDKAMKLGLLGTTGFGEKVLVKITIEFAFTDISKPYGDINRYTPHLTGDLDSNGKDDKLEHTYTTVIVVNRNNWSK
jgi:hypothetical protein